MSKSVYSINKGVNKPIEFKGLKAQYIWYLGGGLLMLLVLFAILYICGVNIYLCLGTIVLLGTFLFFYIYRLSHKYGEHGMLKHLAQKIIPHCITMSTRTTFIYLLKKDTYDKNY